MEYLFVYGTLRKGFHNHYFLENDNVKFIGSGETIDKFAMCVKTSSIFLNRKYNISIPFVTRSPSISTIKGELYLVPNMLLKAIDILEGHPFFYEREKVIVKVNDKLYNAWMYFYNKDLDFNIHTIPNGDFKEIHT